MTPRPLTIADFPPGTRVRLRTGHPHPVMSSLGDGRYVHVNATPFLTGVTLYTPEYYRDMVFFQPDGWPIDCPSAGFGVQIDKIQKWDGDECPCVITDVRRNPISKEQET